MCDLWKNTLAQSVQRGDIPAQIEIALRQLPEARQVKLYNSGSFFDGRAVPFEDYRAIARLVSGFERVVVESHPALIGDRTLEFRDMLGGKLEVAIGLETAHAAVLEKLNKGMTLEQFSSTAAWLNKHSIDLRTFVLVQPPFLPKAEALIWAERSLSLAFANRARVATLIATRGGNGAMEVLKSEGLFRRPLLKVMEAAFEFGLSLRCGRVFVDLWDLEKSVQGCPTCFDARRRRLKTMNLSQQIAPALESCSACGDES